MPTTREEGGGLSEASRLLQEGLQLLEDRRREVDAAVQRARARAQEITEAARERALEITAEAERQRAGVEQQLAALRAEVAAARRELANLKVAPKESAPATPPVVIEAASTSAPETTANAPAEVAPIAAVATVVPVAEAREAPAAREASEVPAAGATPRWGRPSSTAAAQQAIRERGSRPRWLPPWLPFVIVLLAAAGFVAANANTVGSARSLATFGPTGVGARISEAGLTVAAVTLAPTRHPSVLAPARAPLTSPVALSPAPERKIAA